MKNVTTLKALADEKRLKILQLLSESQYCVCALSNITGLSQSAVSQHLKILREAKLVIGEKRGYYTHYVIQTPLLEEVGRSLIDFAKRIETKKCEVECPEKKDNE